MTIVKQSSPKTNKLKLRFATFTMEYQRIQISSSENSVPCVHSMWMMLTVVWFPFCFWTVCMYLSNVFRNLLPFYSFHSIYGWEIRNETKFRLYVLNWNDDETFMITFQNAECTENVWAISYWFEYYKMHSIFPNFIQKLFKFLEQQTILVSNVRKYLIQLVETFNLIKYRQNQNYLRKQTKMLI